MARKSTQAPSAVRSRKAAAVQRLRRAQAMTDRLKLINAEPRLRLLLQLGEGEAPARVIREMCGLSPFSVNRYLMQLRHGQLVAIRRAWRGAFYRLTESGQALVELIRTLPR